ncbi:MAG: iron-sulfur cluster repair di-iron protein, ric [Spirochaetae bacterium HGW-Spirochaetae-4]|jgi:regulator of cell morphogenesis and NO signaling|nr:MAG: iron-sulfur cluster repair di-iron protein, ric [Spirochaetae bacterium HGW-Spirochaetae-8]PKL21072.1 MAG: iron-sulfur cluster repair di-iron protein, ric [Spirochaetae bacterium HGW-Spirochaetae-4]
MFEHVSFDQVRGSYLKTLEQYVPIVARVHGDNHPEFHEVRAVFDVLVGKLRNAGAEKPMLLEEFARLREITHDYRVPQDVCETYEAVYQMLGELDSAFHA